MFTKLDMTNSQHVFTNCTKLCHDDVISDVKANRFRLEFSVFGTCEYSNLISLHPIFTKPDMVDSQPVLTNLIEWLDDDVISDVTTERFWLEFSVFGICEYHNLISLHPIFTKLDMVGNQPLFMNFIGWHHQWRHSWSVSARIRNNSTFWMPYLNKFASNVYQTLYDL